MHHRRFNDGGIITPKHRYGSLPFPSRDGKIKIGLWQAWQVLGHRLPGPARMFLAEQGRRLRDLLDLRNHSILAHGYHPVSAADWRPVGSWTRERFLPVLRALALDASLKDEPWPLPTELPRSFPEAVHEDNGVLPTP